MDPAIADEPFPGRGDILGTHNQTDAAVLLAEQGLHGAVNGVEAVSHHGVTAIVGNGPVHQHHRHVLHNGHEGLSIDLLGDEHNGVHIDIHQQPQLLLLQLCIEIVAAHNGVIAALTQPSIHSRHHPAEKGAGNGGQQNADGHGPVGLETPGKVIDLVVQLGNGRFDPLPILVQDVSAVEIF